MHGIQEDLLTDLCRIHIWTDRIAANEKKKIKSEEMTTDHSTSEMKWKWKRNQKQSKAEMSDLSSFSS